MAAPQCATQPQPSPQRGTSLCLPRTQAQCRVCSSQIRVPRRGSSRHWGWHCNSAAAATASLRPAAAARSASAGPAGQQHAGQEQEQEHVALLDWLVRSQGAAPSCLKVERRYGGAEVGWCLVATADIEPEEVVLSVPLTAAITSDGADESRWSAAMAAQLLEKQAEAAEAAAAAAAEAAAAAGGAAGAAAAAAARSAQPWLDVLPAHVDLPWLYWSDAELAELQDEDTLAEAQQFRSMFEAACEELGSTHCRESVAWALSLVHSRSFVERSSHIWCPGIDMCNHTLSPNADIRCIRSPGSCQGADALDEVCPPETAAAQRQEPDRFELVAGERGIGRGEEVTISYGSWPSDVFLLFFGFVPEDNPNDSAVIFFDLFDMATFKLRSVDLAASSSSSSSGGGSCSSTTSGSGSGAPQQQQEGAEEERSGNEQTEAERDEEWEEAVAAVVQEVEAKLGPQEQFFRMVATAHGLDARLMHAAQALLAAGRGSPDGRQPMSLGAFTQLRCQQLLAAYPTSLAEDEALLKALEQQQQQAAAAAGGAAGAAAEGEPRLAQLGTAVRYRAGKKRVLHATLAAVQQR